MIISLAGAVAAAVFFGVASVLQARGAHAVPAGEGVDPRVMARVLRQWPFLLGLLLDLCGFLAELAALRRLPLFVVQAAIAASLAVTALTATMMLGSRLRRKEWLAVAAVCAGLAALGLSAGAEGTPRVGWSFRWGMVAATSLLAVAGFAAGRLRGRAKTLSLGLCGGLGFGVVAISARVLTGFEPGTLVRDPDTYLLLAGGGLAFLFFTTALQGGAVTPATGAMVIGETVVPAAVGVFLLGDTTRPGFAPVAVVGFVVAVAGALALGRFGEPAEPAEPAEP